MRLMKLAIKYKKEADVNEHESRIIGTSHIRKQLIMKRIVEKCKLKSSAASAAKSSNGIPSDGCIATITSPYQKKLRYSRLNRNTLPISCNLSSMSSRLCLYTVIFCCIIGTSYGNGNDTRDISSDSKNDTRSSNSTSGGEAWREGRTGDGSMHEQVDIPHFIMVNYTDYIDNANYTKARPYNNYGMGPIFKIAHSFWDGILTHDQGIPEGYVELKSDNRLYLGPKALQNDWADLLAEYWVVLLLVFLMILLLLVLPFIAICYCCFCCCRRCGKGCPPCDRKVDGTKRCCYGFLLLLLIIGLIFGLIILIATNRLIERGFRESTETLRRGGKDTCEFLTSTAKHIKHIFVNNYQEMESHLADELTDSPTHTFIDLTDVSRADSLDVLLKILNNMPKALTLMQEIEKMEHEIRFFGSQLRDALRGVKRDLVFATVRLSNIPSTYNFMSTNEVGCLDLGCLHFDTLPNTTIYVEALKDIIGKDYKEHVTFAIANLHEIEKKIGKQMNVVIPPLIEDLRNGGEVLREQSDIIRNLVDAVVSDIHLQTMRTSESFEDVQAKFSPQRNIVNLGVILIIVLILICLIIGLCCGCCGRRPRGYREDCCNKGTGATCLLLAMILIFLTFSILMIIVLFYFIFGLLTYHGACAPLREREENALFKQADKYIDLNRLLPKTLLPRDSTNPLPPLRLSNAISECKENETIYDVLHINHLYDIRKIRGLNILRQINAKNKYNLGTNSQDDMSNIIIMPEKARIDLNMMRVGNLSSYHSSVYTETLCKDFVHMSLPSLAQNLDDYKMSLDWAIYYSARIVFRNQAVHLRAYNEHLLEPLKDRVSKLIKNVQQIDRLLLHQNRNFSDSILTILNDIKASEDFIRARGKNYIQQIAYNLTYYIRSEVDRFREMVIRDAEHEIGRCAPLAYIYDDSVDLVCRRIADPINGFWLGLLICCLLFLPILFVAHKLQCLYRKVDPYEQPVAVAVGGEYLYDAYSEREHLPMASVPKKRRKNGHDRRREHHHDYYEDASPGVSHGGMRESRYNDMAPKHWDSEPPRYHNPPMAPPASEYERPPPYYYPGAAEQD